MAKVPVADEFVAEIPLAKPPVRKNHKTPVTPVLMDVIRWQQYPWQTFEGQKFPEERPPSLLAPASSPTTGEHDQPPVHNADRERRLGTDKEKRRGFGSFGEHQPQFNDPNAGQQPPLNREKRRSVAFGEHQPHYGNNATGRDEAPVKEKRRGFGSLRKGKGNVVKKERRGSWVWT